MLHGPMERDSRRPTSSTFERMLPWTILIALGPAVASSQSRDLETGAPETLLPRSGAPTEPDVVTLDYGLDTYTLLAEHHSRGEPFSLVLPFPGGVDERATLWPVSCLERGARARIVSAEGTAWCEPRARCFSGALEHGGTIFLGCAPGQIHGYAIHDGLLHYLSGGDSRGGIAKLALAKRA